MSNKAKGYPTKEFFVGMLTRDIDLSDAILDLLDNCLDGVVRQKNTSDRKTSNDYYDGYYSRITIKKDYFSIEDNCGGIPRQTAEDYAFRMGRVLGYDSGDKPTVGIYGIGMKRAIFKIGKHATVTTRHNDEFYKVTIPSNWASDDNDDWKFDIEDLSDSSILPDGGTIIEVIDFNDGIVNNWKNDDKILNYVDQLGKTISQSYSLIIQKGFNIHINDKEVSPLHIQLLFSNDFEKDGIRPFLYHQIFDDVEVSLVIGFYAPPPSPDDIDDENELKRSSSDAGWTIICNDRVIIYNDKSYLTGWGEAGVPQYHTQFIGIRGVVTFYSNKPDKLPMTTTKRGIDTSSRIYSVVKDRMRQGMRIFTDYTNRWKGQNEKERVYSNTAQRLSVNSFVGEPTQIEERIPVKFRANKGGYVYNPNLPSPPNDRQYKVIRYSKSIDEILSIVEYIYNDREYSVTPSQIGEKCFDIILDMSQKKEE